MRGSFALEGCDGFACNTVRHGSARNTGGEWRECADSAVLTHILSGT